jgi:hypothetical protein
MLSDPKQTDPESISQNWGTTWGYFRLADRFLLKGNDWQFQVVWVKWIISPTSE